MARKIKVVDVDIDYNPNAGCNNGNFETGVVTFSDGSGVSIETCRCHKGCGGTDRVPAVGQKFNDIDDFWAYCNPEY